MDKDQKRVEEFKEASALHRLQNTLMLGQATIYIAATGGLVSLVFRDSPLVGSQAFVLKIAGVALSVIFFSITERAYKYSEAARDRARTLGEELGFELYSEGSVPKPRLFFAVTAVKLLYIIGGIGWIVLLFIDKD